MRFCRAWVNQTEMRVSLCGLVRPSLHAGTAYLDQAGGSRWAGDCSAKVTPSPRPGLRDGAEGGPSRPPLRWRMSHRLWGTLGEREAYAGVGGYSSGGAQTPVQSRAPPLQCPPRWCALCRSQRILLSTMQTDT